MAKDEYRGEDNKGRVTFGKFQEAKKAIQGPEYKNLMQQFVEKFKTPTTTVAPGKSAKIAALKKKQKSIIPKSPTN
jgi:hypothetical protein